MKNIFNKKTLSSLLVLILTALVAPFHRVFATLNPINYTPLAPLPGFTSIDVTDVSSLSIYLNTMIALFIGISAVLAVIMIVLGGIQYATSELISSKEAGKERIRNALFGLLLALGSWLILNTINPDLLNTNPLSSHLTKQTITVDLDEANYARTEQTVEQAGTTAAKGTLGPGVAAFVANNCSSLNNITVNTATKQANFCAGSNCISVPINVGYNGVSGVGQGKEGDGKTPKGVWHINSDRRIGSGNNAVFSRNGQYNLGSAFINTGATVNGKDRGIGFHGSANNTMGTTNGCIRMSNENIAALAPCMKTGTTVTIQ